jgi:tetratricopeptide (TPR) repeat protein
VSGHYDEAALYDYLDDPESFRDRAALEAHLAQCPRCTTLLGELRSFEEALSSTALWDFADAARRHREPPESIRTIADRLALEDADAEQFLTPILASPAAFRRANVGALPEMRTAGVARKLCTVSRELRERQPMHALALADAAVTIAEQLGPSYPRAVIDEVRGAAWLERANSLRYLGRHPEALDALDIAERAYETTPVAAYSIAIVQYVRAVVFVELDRFDEAQRLARQSARVFRQFGEHDRYLHARMIEACVLFHQNRYDAALALFRPLLQPAKELADTATLARLYLNIASCHLELESFDEAHRHLTQALSLYEALGLETEKIRTRWSLGTLLVKTGQVAEGVRRLHDARREFERLGATTDAALVTLDIVEALLAIERPREAADLCAGLVENFTGSGMTGNALTALAFLREAVAAGSATPILVHHVRTYLQQRAEDHPFLPPAPL